MSGLFFFQSQSVESLASNHLNRIRNLEDDEQKKIIKLYRKVRQDLRDRLDLLPEGSFTYQKLTGVMLQVDSALKEMNSILLSDFGKSAERAAQSGVNHLIEELKVWDQEFTGATIPINVNAVSAGLDTKNFLFNKYESSIASYSSFIRGRIAQGLTESTLQEDSLSEVTQKLAKTFLGEEWRLNRIVRTELHNIYNVGKMRTMRELSENQIPDLKKTLFHPMDARTGKDTKRLAQNNPIVDVDEPFVEKSTGKKLEYMAPPNRPNDRAILIPFREAWKK